MSISRYILYLNLNCLVFHVWLLTSNYKKHKKEHTQYCQESEQSTKSHTQVFLHFFVVGIMVCICGQSWISNSREHNLLVKSGIHVCVCAKSCPTLCDPMDCRPPGSSVHRISRQDSGVGCHALLEAIFLIQRSSRSLSSLLVWHVDSLPLAPPGKPNHGTGHTQRL